MLADELIWKLSGCNFVIRKKKKHDAFQCCVCSPTCRTVHIYVIYGFEKVSFCGSDKVVTVGNAHFKTLHK